MGRIDLAGMARCSGTWAVGVSMLRSQVAQGVVKRRAASQVVGERPAPDLRILDPPEGRTGQLCGTGVGSRCGQKSESPAMVHTKDTAMIGITDTDFLVQSIAPRKK